MNSVTQIFAVLAGLLHIGVFVMESVLFSRPNVQRLFLGNAPSTPQLRTFAFNQGFYNLFLALGAIGGVIAGGPEGRVVALFTCACMAGAGVVLLASQRRMWRGALLQIVPAGIALVAGLL
jgi:putative membrane protein